ncbi:probable leucine-rich repeat receptor-like protein kinase At5g49770 isoform X1 [Camellia sinensis]|uniref:probable leucine-rich repeat receptor-like protein kinase At5g49770 isoform X1 n=1 Tax=Camellia sinensis TaxID=4442 RepID=UPI001036C50B|nr:probable leucine-rich repeat receptor-like protein kinase At5g49770 isoform X1 [Camellia sinensis]XP_028121056.1 probable leucine-rich repeat receptor-like protein kinase At5g49770 isoform X1 [Camellia sinensis]
MGSRIWICLLLVSVQILLVAAQTNNDYIALFALKDVWQNAPPNWVGSDPCGSSWDGIRCTNSRVTSITLASVGLVGQLSGEIELLSELQALDLSYNKGLTGSLPPSIGKLKKLTNLILVGCGFSGPIPDTIGSLQQLRILSLNSNSFTGNIPPAIGNLSKLYWLDLADNKLEGPIPVSPGLDMLVNTKHFHFGKNNLSGEIPSKLFSSKMTLIHVLFESNSLWGSIPSTLGLVHTLEVLRLDRNLLIGPVPSNLNNLVHVQELFLSNNRLTGPLPNLTGMTLLNYVDMSNNTFDVSYFPPWFSTLKSLTTLMMESTQLQGSIPVTLFSLPQLQTVVLRTNQLNGTLDVGSSYSEQLRLIDLQNNLVVSIGDFAKIANGKIKIILARNPVCEETGVTEAYCTIQQPNSSYTTLPDNCTPVMCSSNQISSPHCRCAYPYHGTLFFRAPSFSDLGNSGIYTSLAESMMTFFRSHQLSVDSVYLSNPTKNADDYLVLSVEFFPYGEDRFNRTGISGIGFVFSNQTFKPNNVTFGPYFFIGDLYEYFAEGTKRKSLSIGIIIGAAIGGSVLVLLSLLAGIYAFRQKRRAEIADKQNNPFASWEQNKRSGDVPHLKGARSFSFEELKKYANNFSEGNVIGAGGYGKVYRGALPTGQLVAVKRAQQGSMQGGHEFKTEIELLSRVHHKNVVSLLGFCFEKVEHMLVYEYIPNGTLKESLSGKTGIRLDWMRRLRIALGVARGLQYLHELANPPIIHRDIKSNNILLDERLNAKVSDFGLSKLMGDVEKGHVTTQVKGTMGYMDPEYYMTQQLTEKSDVYSFGVLMLELVTARQPIEKGKYIVREVKLKMDKTQVRYNLHDLLDPTILDLTLGGLDKFVDLAMKCVEDAGAERPTMGEVVNEIENIMRIAGLNPNADSASTSASHEVDSRGYNHPYSDDSLFVYSGAFPPSKLEPQ